MVWYFYCICCGLPFWRVFEFIGPIDNCHHPRCPECRKRATLRIGKALYLSRVRKFKAWLRR